MKNNEISLSAEQAIHVYSQLIFEDVNDSVPFIVDIPDIEKPIIIDDAAAKLFMAKFEREEGHTFSVYGPLDIGTKLLDERIKQIEEDPFLRKFFRDLTDHSGLTNLSDYCLINSLDAEQIEQIIKIARIVQKTSGQNDDDLKPFTRSLQYLIEQRDVYSAVTALENMKQEVKYYLHKTRETLTRDITVRDMAYHLLSLAALNDYELTLQRNFPTAELERLPKLFTGLPGLKELLVSGKISSIFQPNAVKGSALAEYDPEYNTMIYTDKINPQNLFVYQDKDGLMPVQIANHELHHVLQDRDKRNLLRHTTEAEAHLLETFYIALKVGIDRVEKVYKKGFDTKSFDAKSTDNVKAFGRLKKLTGIDEVSFMQMFPVEAISYRYLAAGLVRDVISKVRSGQVVEDVYVGDIAEAYALVNAILIYLSLITSEGDMDKISNLLAAKAKLNMDVVEITQDASGRSVVQRNKIMLPDQLERLGQIDSRQVGVVKWFFENQPDNGFGVWKDTRKNMMLYMICKHSLEPSSFDAGKYFFETFIPFIKLEYTAARHKPHEMGID